MNMWAIFEWILHHFQEHVLLNCYPETLENKMLCSALWYLWNWAPSNIYLCGTFCIVIILILLPGCLTLSQVHIWLHFTAAMWRNLTSKLVTMKLITKILLIFYNMAMKWCYIYNVSHWGHIHVGYTYVRPVCVGNQREIIYIELQEPYCFFPVACCLWLLLSRVEQ